MAGNVATTGLATGEVVLMPAFNASVDKLIHCVGTRVTNPDCERLLEHTYKSLMSAVAHDGLQCVAVASISTGNLGVAPADGTRVAMRMLQCFVRAHPAWCGAVGFVCFERDVFDAFVAEKRRVLAELELSCCCPLTAAGSAACCGCTDCASSFSFSDGTQAYPQRFVLESDWNGRIGVACYEEERFQEFMREKDALLDAELATRIPRAFAMSCAASALQLRAVPGYFVQGDTALPSPSPYPPRLGLAAERSWADVNELVRRSQAANSGGGSKVKLVLLMRHGEALHNADKAEAGAAAWDERLQFHDKYTDAPLTARGVAQARDAAKVLEELVARDGLLIERVIVSPLDRTLQTYELAFANLPHYPASVLEAARETLGVCPCDRRNPLAAKKERYPGVDFGLIADERDELWAAEHRESDAEIEARALEFLGEIYERHAENHFVVVSHSGFSRACYRALGLRHYRPQNAEFMPLLLTSEPSGGTCAAPQ